MLRIPITNGNKSCIPMREDDKMSVQKTEFSIAGTVRTLDAGLSSNMTCQNYPNIVKNPNKK